MIIIALLAGLFTFVLAGIGATLLAQRGRSSLNLLEICACGWFLGTGIVSLLLWSCGVFLSGAGLQILVTILAAMLAATRFVPLEITWSAAPPPRRKVSSSPADRGRLRASLRN